MIEETVQTVYKIGEEVFVDFEEAKAFEQKIIKQQENRTYWKLTYVDQMFQESPKESLYCIILEDKSLAKEYLEDLLYDTFGYKIAYKEGVPFVVWAIEKVDIKQYNIEDFYLLELSQDAEPRLTPVDK